jgi:acetyl esterase/lipase
MLAAVTTALVSLLAPMPQEPITVHEDIQYSEAARQPRRNRLDLYLPTPSLAGQAKPPLVMFVHGGTWTGGHKDGYGRLGLALAQNGYACALINTQLFPFAKPDAMVADCGNALGYLHRHACEYGFDGNQLFVMGHSSGAHLCGWLALDDDLLAAACVPKQALRGSILLSGVYDVRSRHIALDAVFGSDFGYRERATPLMYVEKTDAPVFLAWGQRDLPGLSLCARMMRDRLQQADVPVVTRQYADCNHANYVVEIGSEHDRLMPDVLRFLKNPQAAAAAERTDKPRRTMLWVATNARERAVGDSLRVAMQPHGVEILVHDFDGVTGKMVAATFRELRDARIHQNAVRPSYVGGIGIGGLAAAAAPLSGIADGLLGRIVAATPLGPRSLSAFSQRTIAEDTSNLQEARLLSLLGDRDPRIQIEQANLRTWALLRDGFDAHPIELPNTTVEQALLGLQANDSLLVPLLLAFFHP